MAGIRRTSFRETNYTARGPRLVRLSNSRPQNLFDSDAWDYIRRVEAADGRPLEDRVRVAIDAFVRGCKLDSIWTPIKAACILAGARTLTGALVPLVGTAPTNVNFVSGDYSRKTGLTGDGATKYLDSNRNNNADPQNSNHNAVYRASGSSSGGPALIGTDGSAVTGSNILFLFGGQLYARNRCTTATSLGTLNPIGFVGTSRSGSSNYAVRVNGASTTVTATSETPRNLGVKVFEVGTGEVAFYSIGESVDLALLDARVTTLIKTLAAVLP